MDSFDEYKLFFEHVHTLVNNRQNLTTIYLSVNAAIITAITFIFSTNQANPYLKNFFLIGVMFVGLIACDSWRRLIFQYTTLLSWWYRKLREIESQLPKSNKLLTLEFTELYSSQKEKKYIGLTRYEITLTWLFSAAYIISFCITAAFLIFAIIQKSPIF